MRISYGFAVGGGVPGKNRLFGQKTMIQGLHIRGSIEARSTALGDRSSGFKSANRSIIALAPCQRPNKFNWSEIEAKLEGLADALVLYLSGLLPGSALARREENPFSSLGCQQCLISASEKNIIQIILVLGQSRSNICNVPQSLSDPNHSHSSSTCL